MPTREIPLLSGHFYHIYNRGVNKDPIFFSDQNYSYFMFRFAYYKKEKADLVAYCLMPNHFHLLLRVNDDLFVKTALSPFLISYSKAINLANNRVGPLFQGRFQAKEIDGEGNLMECIRYIHLNPVNANLVSSPDQWKYSSYSDYINQRKNSITNIEIVLQSFSSINDFSNYVLLHIK
jgi:putative transposase